MTKKNELTPQELLDATTDTIAAPERAYLYAPITRIDTENWEVEGVATSEQIDSYGTIFSYDASKRAFQSWIDKHANVREMHDRKAVARGVGVFFDDDNKQVIVRSRVSRGAADTWQKVLDNVLSGYSVGATKAKWTNVERNGKSYPYLTDYELAELSLVDNPSNPDCDIAISRVDEAELTDIVDVTVEDAVVEEIETPDETRAGARVSADTRASLHDARDHTMQSSMKMMNACGCDECRSMCSKIDPDGDGDNDLVTGADADTDSDAAALAERVALIVLHKLERDLSAPLMRIQTIAGTFARTHEVDLSPIQLSIQALETRLADVQATHTTFDEVRSVLTEVKDHVARIAAQPASGGPALQAVDKSFASHSNTQSTEEQILERLAQQGILNTSDKQLAAAALAIKPWK